MLLESKQFLKGSGQLLSPTKKAELDSKMSILEARWGRLQAELDNRYMRLVRIHEKLTKFEELLHPFLVCQSSCESQKYSNICNKQNWSHPYRAFFFYRSRIYSYLMEVCTREMKQERSWWKKGRFSWVFWYISVYGLLFNDKEVQGKAGKKHNRNTKGLRDERLSKFIEVYRFFLVR